MGMHKIIKIQPEIAQFGERIKHLAD